MQNKHEEQTTQPAVTSEPIRFTSDEMVTCNACGRTNPPNRLNCLYCGVVFSIGSIDASRLRVTPRTLENWEKGVNIVVITSSGNIDTRVMSEVSYNTGIDVGSLDAVKRMTGPLAVARVELETEAAAIAANLERIGLITKLISDEELMAEHTFRCRSMDFGKESLTFHQFNEKTRIEIHRDDVRLLVTGSIRESKIESAEQRKRSAKSVIDESHTSSDMPVVDIYSETCRAGIRIFATGFDFSCLGTAKTYVSGSNLTNLVDKICTFASNATIDTNYADSRSILDTVWEVDRRSDLLGKRRAGFFKSVSTSVETSNNLLQFTKYSRLKWHLL